MTYLGITASKKKCNNKVLIGQYCHYHKSQQKATLMIDAHAEENQIGKDPCSICLCDVDETEDCFLTCSHPHHVLCVKQLIEPFCPVCRGPLQFKKTPKINIKKIQKKSDKEKLLREKEQMQGSIDLAKELNEENSIIPVKDVKDDKELELLDKVLEESILSAEIDEYSFISKMVEASYYFAQEEDEALLEKVMKENIEINKHDWCEEDIKTLMKGQTRTIVQLK